MSRVLCIDFETANKFAGSICSVGLAVIDDCKIVDTRHWLIKPHTKCNYFDYYNVSIHGINAETVKNKPEFDAVYAELRLLFENAVIVAHNTDFDINVLCHGLNLYGIEYPKISFLCTYKTALRTWIGLENYKLSTICKFIKYDFVQHNAREDAIACGKVMLAALTEKGVTSINELADSVGLNLGKLHNGGYIPCSPSNKSV